MKLDSVVQQGDSSNPAAIFIHGLGMDKNIWVDPGSSRILGGMLPLKILFSNRFSGVSAEQMQTLFDDLKIRGHSVITWSQRRPAGPIGFAVAELREIMKMAHEVTQDGIILIGHSRGGLIGRKYLLNNDPAVRGLITIATPHQGSSAARFTKYVSPLVSMIHPFIPDGNKGTVTFAVKRVLEFLKSSALKELLPGSNFFKSLHDGPLGWIRYASGGGTNPTLFRIGKTAVPDVLEKVIPEKLYPEEMKQGKGDGLVSALSSRLPWGQEHYDFNCNHAEILFDENVRDILGKIIEKMS
jgi:pimeloyl-ACP methyl ester carboxylesterase